METQQTEIVDILPIYDLQQRSTQEQIKHVEAYRKNFTNKEITDFWGKKEAFMYTYIKRLGIKTSYKKRVPKAKPVKEKVEQVKEVEKVAPPVAPEVTEAPEIPEGFGFHINGTYNTETLIKRLEKLSLVLNDEDSEFEVKLSIKEKIETV